MAAATATAAAATTATEAAATTSIPAAATSAAVSSHLGQPGVDLLLSLLQDRHEVARLLRICVGPVSHPPVQKGGGGEQGGWE